MHHAALPSNHALRVTSYSRAPTDIERIFYLAIVRQLAQRRISLGLTQEELDDELGVSDGQVAKWESFARLPGAFMFMCWANRLGLILTIDDEPPPQQDAPDQCHIATLPRPRAPLPRPARVEARQLPLW